MWCYVCDKKFYIKRTFLSLFDSKTKFICDNCYNKNPIIPKINLIPIDNGEVIIVSLIDTIPTCRSTPHKGSRQRWQTHRAPLRRC